MESSNRTFICLRDWPISRVLFIDWVSLRSCTIGIREFSLKVDHLKYGSSAVLKRVPEGDSDNGVWDVDFAFATLTEYPRLLETI